MCSAVSTPTPPVLPQSAVPLIVPAVAAVSNVNDLGAGIPPAHEILARSVLLDGLCPGLPVPVPTSI